MTSPSANDGFETHERRAPRRSITMDASLRASTDKPFKVQVHDLSATGFGIETFAALHPGVDLWLRLPGLEPRHATVMWVEGDNAGCAFKTPLHEAVVETIAKKAR